LLTIADFSDEQNGQPYLGMVSHGPALGLNPDKFMKYTGFIETPWWQVVYKIPRRW
jgi:hypothetical protein